MSTGSPCGVELPCFARYWSRGFAEEPTGDWSVGRPGDDWLIVCCAAQASLYQHSISVLGDLLNAFAGDLQLLHMHEGVEDYLRLTLYWPYCRSFRVEGFSPRNPILPWVRATLSWCRMFWV